MLEVAARHLLGAELDVLHFAAHFGVGLVGDLVGAVQHHHVVVVQVDDLGSVLHDGGHVRSEEKLAVAHAQYQGAAAPRADEHAGLVGRDHHDAEGAFQMGQGFRNGLGQIAGSSRVGVGLVELVDQVDDDLGIGLGLEHHAFLLEGGLDDAVVFDDAVVHHGDIAVHAGMGMGVHDRRRAVGGPAGMPDSHPAGHGRGLEQVVQLLKLALGAHQVQLVFLLDADSRAVIPAVFQLPESFDQDLLGVTRSGVGYDSAHCGALSLNNEK